MARRHLLKPDEQVALFDVPTDEESLIRQYTLSGEDLKFALSKRGQRNQLGFAVQLCLMRHPGRCLAQGEQVPAAMVAFIANQLSVEATAFVDYARRDNTRREHAAELQRYLDLRLSNPRGQAYSVARGDRCGRRYR